MFFAPTLLHGFIFSYFYLEGFKIILELNRDEISLWREGKVYHYKVYPAAIIEGRICQVIQSIILR